MSRIEVRARVALKYDITFEVVKTAKKLMVVVWFVFPHGALGHYQRFTETLPNPEDRGYTSLQNTGNQL
jgi:hypothetical protein